MHTASPSVSSYLPNLTPLRGVAALIVLLFHFDLYWGGPAVGALVDSTTSHFFKKGYIQVDFFFVLSGFIMCYVYGSWFSSVVTPKSFWRFIKARFARIYPLYLFTVGWSILLYAGIIWIDFPLAEGETSVYNLWALPANLLLAQAMGMYPVFTWNAPSWTISVEWWTYLIFPCIYTYARRLTGGGRLVVLLLLLIGYALLAYVWNRSPAYPWFHSLNVSPYKGGAFIRCLLSFGLGMVVHSLYQQQWGQRWLANGYAMLGFVGWMLLSMHLGLSDLITVATFPFIILSAAYGSVYVNNLLASRSLQRLGNLSFSIYLTNELIFDTAKVTRYALGKPVLPSATTLLGTWMWCLSWIATVLAVSALTYHFIEVPARRQLNRGWATPEQPGSRSTMLFSGKAVP